MTKPAPNVAGDHSFCNSSKGLYPQKAKGMSFFAFLLSTFVYISVFYIFNLSPSTLFNTTKFWFFITNTLILIIAADYGAFSSSKEEQGLYADEYMNMPSKVKTSVSSLVSQYPEVVDKETNRPEIRSKEVVVWHEKKIITQESDSFPESNIPHEVVTNTDHSEKHDHVHHDEDWQEKRPHEVLTPKADHKIHSRTSYRRVKSEKARRVVIDESKNEIRRNSTETAKREPNLEENDQFSTMSDEELNRRVEEFIQWFNGQIRLQATRKYSGEI
ncbi:uncharacterized protein LOC121265678 [Juglans microcarpa x Juglans regia]|uniref:uncharacterized protein LOC121265678 n=1 Tax=Juglans microcarpa x Juglans regia TaxID=2249226 RepID=UPI001B7DB5B9|nr:uncharacterized protein LOC121265678 [Juglans microcarpa x Juglans regia]